MTSFTDILREQEMTTDDIVTGVLEIDNSLYYQNVEDILNISGEIHDEETFLLICDLFKLTLSLSQQEMTLSRTQIKEVIKSKDVVKVDLNNFFREIKCKPLLYTLIFKKCQYVVLRYIIKVQYLIIRNVPRDSQEDLCVLLSIFEEYIPTYLSALDSCEEAFEKYENLMVNYFDIILSSNFTLNQEESYETLAEVIDKARTACKDMWFILCDLLKFDFATHGLY